MWHKHRSDFCVGFFIGIRLILEVIKDVYQLFSSTTRPLFTSCEGQRGTKRHKLAPADGDKLIRNHQKGNHEL